MLTYITVLDVDDQIGPEWAPGDKKYAAVMQANVWLTNKDLPDINPFPQEWILAGAQIAVDASKGLLYQAVEHGLTSKSASAGNVSSSKTYVGKARAQSSGETLALALLKPWLKSNGMIKLIRA